MIRIAVGREPVRVLLTGPFEGAALTVRRLTTPDYARAQGRAAALLRDKAALAVILTRHGLVETAEDLKRAQTDPAFAAGFAIWLATVECALAGVLDWEGIVDETGAKAPLAADVSRVGGVADPVDAADLAARQVMEGLLLDPAFSRQVEAALNGASRLLAVEGNASGLSVNGSGVAPPKTPGGPTGADAARQPRKAARKAAETA